VIDENDNRVFERKMLNDTRLLIAALSKYRSQLKSIAIESTFNWYWLSDALIEAGFHVSPVKQQRWFSTMGLNALMIDTILFFSHT